MHPLFRKWYLSLKVLPLAVAAVGLKFVFHSMGWEVLSLSPLFSGLLAATVFLLGFLMSGVLTDYKESEKLPGELVVSLEAIFDEASMLYTGKGVARAEELRRHVLALVGSTRGWFLRRVPTEDVLEAVTALNGHFVALEGPAPPPFIIRMKQEQSSLRRVLIRIGVIRDTSFVSSGYTIAEVSSTLLLVGFALARIDPFYESLFFVGLITFFLTYMLALIRDLDDPFDFAPDGARGPDEISLQPLADLEARLRKAMDSPRAGTRGPALGGNHESDRQ